ncbi:hypothetical protein ACHAW5_004264 [Stephanodiscus triporus]|uniref:Choline transporter-like protein n=1 Tax=Stephanodiscus triporus TaxID=2934178 RepID=A0ABD3MME8_9STRA
MKNSISYEDDSNEAESYARMDARDLTENLSSEKAKKALTSKPRGKATHLKFLSKPKDEDNQTYVMMENGSIADSKEDEEDVDRKEMLDRMFVGLFLFHLGVVLLYPFVMGTAVRCVPTPRDLIFANLQSLSCHWFTHDLKAGYGTVAYLIVECSMFAAVVSVGIFFIMVKFPGKWLRSSMIISLNVLFGVLFVAFLREDSAPCLTLLVIFVLSAMYCKYSWKRLPNIMHVSAARLVGEWWLSPGEGILMGPSLFVNCFLGLRKLVMHNYKNQGGDSRLLLFVHDASVYTNKWGFVYVGLYEYSFFRAGREVAILFQDKGWHQLIADDLTDNILLIINLAVATSTGAFSWLLAANNTDYYMLRNLSYYHPYTTGFFVGFFAGFLVSSVLIAVFGGVANAIIVCFAERPHILENMHPSQFAMLLDGWSLELPEGIKKPKSRGRNIYEEGTKKKKKKKKKETKKSIWSKEEPILEDLIVDNLQKGLDIIETAIR